MTFAIRASAGGVVVGPNGKIVLVEQHGNSWSFPKGGIDPGENALEAAVREIGEETGLTDLTLKGELGTYERYSINKEGTGEMSELGLRPRTLFLFTTAQEKLTAQDGEVTEARWVSIEEALLLLTHPKDREFLQNKVDAIEALLH